MSLHFSRGRIAALAVACVAFTGLLQPAAQAAPEASASPFQLRLHDTFRDGVDRDQWGAYSGQPGGDPYGWWKQSHVVGTHGSALLDGYREGGRFVTGGMMLWKQPQTYGKWIVRAKFGKSASIQDCLLLWPTQGWPPEIDFAEGPTTQGVMATSHWSVDNEQQHAFRQVDTTKWHTYGVEWTPTKLVFTMDGVRWAEMTGPAVPHQPMHLAIQTAAVSPTGPVSAANPANVRLTISDVIVWRYVPTSNS